MNGAIAGDASGTVLIVDDDFSVRLLAREALEQAGFFVLENDDGAGVLPQFEEQVPDIVLLDVMLPGMNGFTLCREIRAHPQGANTPILMMTGLDDVASIRKAYEAGATDFIAKPFNWLILAYRVRYMMRSSQLFLNLGKSQASLNYAQKIAGLGSWEWDIDSDKLQWSEAVYRMFQIDPIGFDGTYHAFLNSVHPLDKKLVNAALVALAASMKMSVVAEGVETMEQLDFLRELGCRHIQGYLFSRPLLQEDATRLLLDEGGRLAPQTCRTEGGNS